MRRQHRFVPLLALAAGLLATDAFAASGASVAGPASLAPESLATRAGQAFDEKRFAEAARLYRQWADHERDGHALLMAAVASFAIDDRAAARGDLVRARQRGLGPADEELAQLYDDLLADGDSPAAWDLALTSTLGAGYDGNARLLSPGALEAATATGEGPSALFASAGLTLGVSKDWEGYLLELGYELYQSAYTDRGLADLDYQEHALEALFDLTLSPLLRLSFLARDELAFTGLGTRLVPFQNNIRGDAEVIFGPRQARLRLAVAGQGTNTLDPALSFLTGTRLELRATPEALFAGWRLSATARLRQDWLGASRTDPRPDEDRIDSCDVCTVTSVAPYSNRAGALALRVTGTLAARLRPGLSLRYEQRRHTAPEYIAQGGDGTVVRTALGTRRDERLGAGASLGLRISNDWLLTARYDFARLVSLRSDGAPGTSRRYDKHGVSVELAIDWR